MEGRGTKSLVSTLGCADSFQRANVVDTEDWVRARMGRKRGWRGVEVGFWSSEIFFGIS